MSEAKKGILSPNYGKKMSKKFCENISLRQLGSNNPYAKLSEKQVLDIRKLNISDKKIAEIYNVSRKCISKIRKRITWKHI